MHHATKFKVSHAQIIQETFDDEVVVVNLGAGTYYSLGNSGTDIWNLALGGNTTGEIVAALSARYEATSEEIESVTVAFLQQLQDEELLAITESSADEVTQSTASPSEVRRVPFVAPHLQKFTDMQALLMLDPIHEVDEAGWPNVKAINERSLNPTP